VVKVDAASIWLLGGSDVEGAMVTNVIEPTEPIREVENKTLVGIVGPSATVFPTEPAMTKCGVPPNSK
jgi:hypothetical protein